MVSFSQKAYTLMKKGFERKRLLFRIFVSLLAVTACFLGLRAALGPENYISIAVPRGIAALCLMWCIGLFDCFDPD
jgi:hypothetical protein